MPRRGTGCARCGRGGTEGIGDPRAGAREATYATRSPVWLTALPAAHYGGLASYLVGTLLFVMLLGVGVCGLLLLSSRRTGAAGRRLAQVGFVGALGLLALFILISVLTLPFE